MKTFPKIFCGCSNFQKYCSLLQHLTSKVCMYVRKFVVPRKPIIFVGILCGWSMLKIMMMMFSNNAKPKVVDDDHQHHPHDYHNVDVHVQV